MAYSCNKVLFSGSLDAAQTIGQGLPICFTGNIAVRCRFTNTSITLAEPGVYLVNANASAASTSSSGSDVIVELRRNGTQVSNVQSTSTSSGASDIQSVSLTSIVRVDATRCPIDDRSATLTLVNAGEEAVYSNVSITVVRL